MRRERLWTDNLSCQLTVRAYHLLGTRTAIMADEERRRPYPYGYHTDTSGGLMPVRPDDLNPCALTFEDEEVLDSKAIDDVPNSNRDGEASSISKPSDKNNTGTNPLTMLSSLEQMRPKLSAPDQETLSDIRLKRSAQLGSEG